MTIIKLERLWINTLAHSNVSQIRGDQSTTRERLFDCSF